LAYSFKDNTYSTKPKDDPKDRIEVEIGDSKQVSDFLPQVKVMRWDNEVNLSLRLISDEDKKLKPTLVGDKIKLKGKDVFADFYEITEGEGGYEFEVILEKKPVSNIIQFSLQTKGLDFIYQPFLAHTDPDGSTWDDSRLGIGIKGVRRPVNVNGSYAIYTSEKKINWSDGKEYKCGKVGHIYRPQLIDADGVKEWGVLNVDLDAKLLTVTIPQVFLDTAKYPIRHAAGLTIGYSTTGASIGDIVNSSGIALGVFIYTDVPVNGVVDSVSFNNYEQSGTTNIKGFVVNASTLEILTNGITGAQTVTTAQWYTINYGAKPVLVAGTSYAPFIIVSTSSYIYIRADTGVSGDSQYETDENYTTPANPAGLTSVAYRYNIYATYTAATATCAITGTATASITEADVVAGSKTIIATLTDDVFIPAIGKVEFVAASTGVTAVAANPPTSTLTLPTLIADDIIVIHIMSKTIGGGANEINTPTDYTELGSKVNIDSTTAADDMRSAVYWKRAVAGDSGASVTISRAGTDTLGLYSRAYVFRNCVKSGDPFETFVAGAGDTTADDTVNYPAIDPTGTAVHVCYMFVHADDVTIPPYSFVNDSTTFIQRSEAETSTGSDCTMGIYSADRSGSALGAVALDINGTVGSDIGYSFALTPCTFDSIRQVIINGLDSAQAEGTGWDVEVKAKLAVTTVALTSASVVTITLSAQAGYDITAHETITVTIPAAATVRGGALVGSPTFTVDTAAASTIAVSKIDKSTIRDIPTVQFDAFKVSKADKATIRDIVYIFLSIIQKSKADSATIRDVVRIMLDAFKVSKVDKATIKDVATIFFSIINRSSVDTATISAILSVMLDKAIVSKTDKATVREIFTIILNALCPSQTDRATVKDVLTVMFDRLVSSRVDKATIRDTLTVILNVLNITKADTATAGDVPTVALSTFLFDYDLSTSDVATLREELSIILDKFIPSFVDRATVRDIFTVMYEQLVISSVDIMTIQDAAVVMLNFLIASRVEFVTLKDLLTIQMDVYNVAGVDTVTIRDLHTILVRLDEMYASFWDSAIVLDIATIQHDLFNVFPISRTSVRDAFSVSLFGGAGYLGIPNIPNIGFLNNKIGGRIYY
jgi:hypothetical protein